MNGHNFFYQKIKNRVSSRLLAKIRVSQVFWEPIKNRASPRSALLKAVYLEALLYMVFFVKIKENNLIIFLLRFTYKFVICSLIGSRESCENWTTDVAMTSIKST